MLSWEQPSLLWNQTTGQALLNPPVNLPHRLLSWISRMISWFTSYQSALGCHWKTVTLLPTEEADWQKTVSSDRGADDEAETKVRGAKILHVSAVKVIISNILIWYQARLCRLTMMALFRVSPEGLCRSEHDQLHFVNLKQISVSNIGSQAVFTSVISRSNPAAV